MRLQDFVYIDAYKQKNLGDDLFLHIMFRRYPNVLFLLSADEEYKNLFKKYKNVKILTNKFYDRKINFFYRYRHHKNNLYGEYIKGCKAAVYIGGSIFQEPKVPMLLDRYINEHSFILGCNYGPADTTFYYELIQKILSRMDDVCFRDQTSYTRFSSLKNTRYAPDILFMLKKYYPIQIKSEESHRIFISLMDFATARPELGGFADAYDRFITMQIQKACLEKKEIILSSFCKNENDEAAVERILSGLSPAEQKKVMIMNYDGSNEMDILQAIADSSLVIGTRFHSMIFGFLFGKAVIPICYSNKHMEFLKDTGIPKETVLSVQDLKHPPEKPKAYKLTNSQIAEFEQKAEQHFSALDQFMYTIS